MTVKLIAVLLLLIPAMAVANFGQSTAFVYQGSLNNSGTPANGNFDFEFALFDSQSAGTQVGTTLSRSSVGVANGIFSVQLDFGDQFPGTARFLEIRVRSAGGGSFTLLSPRQPLSSAPYSIKSLSAATATTATNADQLGGVAAGQYVLTSDVRMSNARDPLPGSGDYIQNQNSAQQTANFSLNGTGKANSFDAGISFKILGNQALTVPGLSNLAVGLNSGQNITSGNQNVILGMSSGNALTTGSRNTFSGFYAGQDAATGDDNSFFGGQSGKANSSGSRNTFAGRLSGFINSTGNENSFFGFNSGNANTTGRNNTAIGSNANTGSNIRIFGTAIGSYSTVPADDTIVLGKVAGTYDGIARPADAVIVPGSLNVSGTFEANILNAGTQYNIGGTRILGNTGTNNTFVGASTGNGLTSGAGNSFFGSGSGTATTSGISNSFFGYIAGAGNTNGQGNSYFGAAAGNSGNGNHNSFFGRQAGLNASGGQNAFFGAYTGLGVTSSDNALFGYEAGKVTTTGAGNTFIGRGSGVSNQSGGYNAFIGMGSGSSNTTGSYNVFVSGGVRNTTGTYNTIIGSFADSGQIGQPTGGEDLQFATAIGSYSHVETSNTIVLGKASININSVQYPADAVKIPGTLEISGSSSANSVNTATEYSIGGGPALSFGNNITNLHVGGSSPSSSGTGLSFAGRFAGFANTTGSNNSFFGSESGRLNTSGSSNSFFGRSAGQNNTTGGSNTFAGASTGNANTSGSSNTFLGSGSGNTNTTGSSNTVVGAGANVGFQALSFATAVGAGATVFDNNSVVLGRSADTVRIPGSLSGNNISGTFITGTRLGAGTSSPTSPVHAVGEILSDGSQAGFSFSDRGTPGAKWTLWSSGFLVRLTQAGSDKLAVDLNGKLSIGNLDSATSTHVCWNTGSGYFSFCSSSRRYKSDIWDYVPGLDVVSKLRPVSFVWKGKTDRELGFIAEEVAEVEPFLSFKNKSGEIEGVNYDKITTVLVNAVKEQQTQLEQLETLIKAQQTQIERQQSEIETLRLLICRDQKESAVCRDRK